MHIGDVIKPDCRKRLAELPVWLISRHWARARFHRVRKKWDKTGMGVKRDKKESGKKIQNSHSHNLILFAAYTAVNRDGCEEYRLETRYLDCYRSM
jgi:hypothetical protein